MNPVRAGVLAGLTVVSALAVEFGPLALSVPGGLLLAFVLPGLAINDALFRPGRRDIGVVERTILVPALSLAVLVLGGLLLWGAGGNLNRTSWMLVCAMGTLIAIGVAVYRTHTGATVAASPGKAGGERRAVSKQRLIRDVLPLALAAVMLAGVGIWSFADSEQTYDIAVTSLSAAPPGAVDPAGNRPVQVTAAGLSASAGPYTMVVTGTSGEELSRHDITPDTDGDWTGRLTVPADERVTVNLFRGGETAAFRTLIIAAAA
ncbi:hypothetical protein FHR83_002369 [Actinoplanes campanulatus]|uniref:DUF1616 domain-containing protein n=1 Tax=Actinoplanes campanulatus TaxID=113559 RepID=A0A7W5FDV3_9ACTN|nr:DUF1616 domain-containing protein [Actinoplanes campanulatus]MBB3094706.1 hypothetical protein [Actinoplanes campanulatus]GGN06926.1 hypothetical protein GCM10010109_14950 [Actinoplanes campanulatus]GID36003.1 hypothetical protein Aca09nite_25090 [Actinoplanes campanulatus]